LAGLLTGTAGNNCAPVPGMRNCCASRGSAARGEAKTQKLTKQVPEWGPPGGSARQRPCFPPAPELESSRHEPNQAKPAFGPILVGGTARVAYFFKLRDFEKRFDTMGVDELRRWRVYWTEHAQGLAPKVRKQAMKRVDEIEKAIQKQSQEDSADE